MKTEASAYQHDFDRRSNFDALFSGHAVKCSKCSTSKKMVGNGGRGLDPLYSLDDGETWSAEEPVCAVTPSAATLRREEAEKLARRPKTINFEMTPDEAAMACGALMMRPETQALGLRLARLYGAAI